MIVPVVAHVVTHVVVHVVVHKVGLAVGWYHLYISHLWARNFLLVCLQSSERKHETSCISQIHNIPQRVPQISFSSLPTSVF